MLRRRFLCFSFLLVCAAAPFAYSQSPTVASAEAVNASEATHSSDPTIDTIRKEIDASVAAFNKHDAKAVAAFWTLDGEYIDESGTRIVGRAEIEAYFADVFAASPDATLQLATDSIRLLNGGAAIEDGQAIVQPTPNTVAEVSKYTAVHVQVDGKWLVASLRDTWADNGSPSDDLADLDFLIGEWTAEESGARTESKCRWIVNNQFVERTYTTTQVDGSVTTGLQIIGWNSQANHIQSWNFTADGGHAIGVWSATEGGWLAKVTGTSGTNVSSSAINLLRRLDDNAYVWQSMNRTIGDVRLPDTDEVIIRRKPTAN